MGANPVSVLRLEPSADLLPYLRNVWAVDWDVPAGQERTQPVLPPPAVNITVQPGEDAVTGVQTRVDHRVLSGRGWVRGLLFRPAGFAAVVGPCLSEWVDRREPVGTCLLEVEGLRQELLSTEDPVVQGDVFEHWLRPQIRDSEPERREQVEQIVAAAQREPELIRVSDLYKHCGVSERTLQRLLRAWVGVGPKQLLMRFRLQDASHTLTHEPLTDLAELALRLGYADQAHFSRDFARIVGTSPGTYARACR